MRTPRGRAVFLLNAVVMERGWLRGLEFPILMPAGTLVGP